MKNLRIWGMSFAWLCQSVWVLAGCGGVESAADNDRATKNNEAFCSFHYCPAGYNTQHHAGGEVTCERERELAPCTTATVATDCSATDATYQCLDNVCVKSSECFGNNDCALFELCLSWEDPDPGCMRSDELDLVCGGDTLPGTCTALPATCDSATPGSVLIGCDGMIYASSCWAHLAGTSDSHLSVD